MGASIQAEVGQARPSSPLHSCGDEFTRANDAYWRRHDLWAWGQIAPEAEAHRAEVQRFADKFTAYYLPIVARLAAITFIISRNSLSTAAVLVMACWCSIALATSIAMLASIGRGAKRGLLIKGGKYIETLARADVLILDKTGTLAGRKSPM